MPIDYSVVRYSTPEDITAAYTSGCTYETHEAFAAADFALSGAVVGLDADMVIHQESSELTRFAETLREYRLWGFSVGNVVHLWVGPNATREDIASLLGHELGHVVRSEDANARARTIADDDEDAQRAHHDAEEAVADTYGDVAAAVVTFLATECFAPSPEEVPNGE